MLVGVSNRSGRRRRRRREREERNTYMIFNPRYALDGAPYVPNNLAPAYSRIPLSGPRSLACACVAARCCRRCASVAVEPSILGRKRLLALISVALEGKAGEKEGKKDGKKGRQKTHQR
jgi:hypothetical protein